MKATPGNLCSHVREGFIWALLIFMLTAEQMKSDDKLLDAVQDRQPLIATFSIVAFDPLSGDLGVAVQSKFFGVGTVVPWAKANVGAVATQSYANITYGTEGLSLLEQSIHPKVALMQLTNSDNDNAYRQVSMIDASGRTSSFTGSRCNDWAGHIAGPNFAVQGNLLAGQAVVEGMAKAFETSSNIPGTELADWLMASLQAGQDAGGDRRGRQSAALLVVRAHAGYAGMNDRYIDLRVEDHQTPIMELARLLEIHKLFYKKAHENKPERLLQKSD
jgi:uncharacterized Ntn-hydrolase superfamily protein